MLIKYHLNGKTIDLTSDNININSNNFKVDKNGNATMNGVSATNLNVNGGSIHLNGGEEYDQVFNVDGRDGYTKIWSTSIRMLGKGAFGHPILILDSDINRGPSEIKLASYDNGAILELGDGYDGGFIELDGVNRKLSVRGPAYANSWNNNSLEELKKNIQRFNEKAIDIIRRNDIYKFNYKNEEENEKEHIGIIIGKDYNYATEITNNNNNSIDIYSMVSVAYKAIQEQQEIIEQLQKRIDKLEKGEQNG